MFLAQNISNSFVGNFGWIIAGIIVLVGLALGWQDLLRINLKRIWAISSVCFRESIRRRVLWVTPLAMLGIIAVSQLSHPSDEQDTIRQTTKYCLFASGIVVVLTSLILACTSLPKEIENRVIYTIVTKPTTRLEIVLGKTVGFARTSAMILLVMGLFSYIYLQINAAQLTTSIRTALKSMPASDLSRDTLEHYLNEGLLQARTYVLPEPGGWNKTPGFQIYAKVPAPQDQYTWIFGDKEHQVFFPFEVPKEIFTHSEAHLIFSLQTYVKQPRPLNKREIESEAVDSTATTRATTRGVEKHPGQAAIQASILNEHGFAAVPPNMLMDDVHTKTQLREPTEFKNAVSLKLEPKTTDGLARAQLVAPAKSVHEGIGAIPPAPDGGRRIYLMVTGISPATLYGFPADAVTLTAEVFDPQGKPIYLNIKGQRPIFRGRLSTRQNQQLRGDSDPAEAPVGVFQFRDPGFVASGATVPVEFRTKIERSDDASEANDATKVEMVVINRKTGFKSDPIMVTADSDRPTFFNVPRAGVEGGDFDLIMRCHSEGHYVGLRTGSISIASSTQSFAFNLAKSLFILWLLSVLVVIISIFSSTFVSWPIAVVLSLVLLLGRWCVVQLGTPSTPAQIISDVFGAKADPVTSRVLSDTMGALNKLLAVAGKVLPDLDQFRVTENIERGVNIPWQYLIDPLMVILTFGTLLLILAYIFLRQKEVAP
jgi:hypothetical protein